MAYLIRHGICILFLLCISTASIKSSAIAVETGNEQAQSQPYDRLESLPPQQRIWLQLLINKEYERAIATIDPQVLSPHQLDLEVISTGHPGLVRAFAEIMCPHFENVWDSMFSYATWKGYLSICEILWELRYLTKVDHLKCLVTSLVHAAMCGNKEFVTWSLRVLKELNALSLINTVNALLVCEKKSRRQGYGMSTTEHHYLHPIAPAVCNNHKEIVITLLQHGADPTIEAGDMPTLYYATRYGHKEMRLFLSAFDFLKLRILHFVQNSSPQKPDDATKAHENDTNLQGYNNHLKAVRALFQCPALAAECIADAQGNNVAHLAVLARNPKLIKLSLWANPALITLKNNNSLTPLDIAYAKDCKDSLNAILEFCFAIQYYVRNHPKLNNFKLAE